MGILFLIASVIIRNAELFPFRYTNQTILQLLLQIKQVILGDLLETIVIAAIVGTPIAMYPILKKNNEGLAFRYFAN